MAMRPVSSGWRRASRVGRGVEMLVVAVFQFGEGQASAHARLGLADRKAGGGRGTQRQHGRTAAQGVAAAEAGRDHLGDLGRGAFVRRNVLGFLRIAGERFQVRGIGHRRPPADWRWVTKRSRETIRRRHDNDVAGRLRFALEPRSTLTVLTPNASTA